METHFPPAFPEKYLNKEPEKGEICEMMGDTPTYGRILRVSSHTPEPEAFFILLSPQTSAGGSPITFLKVPTKLLRVLSPEQIDHILRHGQRNSYANKTHT